MLHAKILLCLMIGTFPQLVFAGASNTIKIGISVVVKEPTKCDFHISTDGNAALYNESSSNCVIQADNLKKHLNNINYQQHIESSTNEFARIVMVVQ
ncbi:hypothetical protein GCM10009133_30430 [Cocleimonas flava]|uniref:Uncharacterized protein n=2 Tax=Cocleimonas flava TaxID=634765 RepID=A0A4R1F5F2_9GAMM|nr:hypothetical protein EV695_0974 [Cocleimonas flava]